MAGSLRVNLLRLLIPPVAVILAVGSIAAYYLSIDPATDAYDQSLINTAIALAERIRIQEDKPVFDLPSAAEAVVRTDKYDKVYYVVRDPQGQVIAGDQDIPLPPPGLRPTRASSPTTPNRMDGGCGSPRCWCPAAAARARSTWPRPRSNASASRATS